MCDPPPCRTHAPEGDVGRAAGSSPRQAGPTLSVALCVPGGQHRGAEEALAVLVAPADLVAALGELLRRTGNTAVVLVPGAIAAGLAREGWDTGGSAAALPRRPPRDPEVPMRQAHRLLPGSPLSGRGLSDPQPPPPSALSRGSPLPHPSDAAPPAGSRINSSGQADGPGSAHSARGPQTPQPHSGSWHLAGALCRALPRGVPSTPASHAGSLHLAGPCSGAGLTR